MLHTSHFLTLQDLSLEQHYQLIKRAIVLKKNRTNNQPQETSLTGKILAMIFEKNSTRTRVSFEAGMLQLGGQALFIPANNTQLSRGESITDSAKVISSMVDLIMLRTYSHQRIIQFSAHSSVPVINGLTDQYHPCQLLADLMTLYEHFDKLEGLKIAWIGDGNNMCNSYIQAAQIFNIELRIYAPEKYQPKIDNITHKTQHKNTITLCESPQQAASEVDVVVTDVCLSMGQEDEKSQRVINFADCIVDSDLMNKAKKHAVFLHCLPAHRGEEVSAEVIDGKQSLVWQQAENRLHAQKALMEIMLR